MAGERAPEPVMVQEKSNGHLRLVDAGTGAVLHGMMSMLSEVLDGLDRRLDSLESRLDELGRPRDTTTAVVDAMRDQLDGVESRLGALVRERVDAERESVESLLCERLEALGERFDDAARADEERSERVSALEAAVVGQGELFANVQASVEASVVRVEESVQAAVSRRLAQVEASLAEGRAEAEATVAKIGSQLESGLADDRTALASWIEEALSGLSSAVQGRLDAMQARLDEQGNNVRAGITEHLDALEVRVAGRVDQAAGRVAERVSQTEQLSLGRLEQTERELGQRVDAAAAEAAERASEVAGAVESVIAGIGGMEGKVVAGQADVSGAIEAVTLQLAEVDATLAAVRAEGAALPASIGEVVGTALSSWRNRLRKGDGEDGLRKTFDELATRLGRVEDLVGDGLSRVHEAVNRAQGESLDAAQTTTAEVRRLLDAARADAERIAAETVEGVVSEQRKLAGEVVEHLRKPTPADEEQLDAVAAVAERLVAMHEEVGRRNAALAKVIEESGESARQRVAEAEVAVTAALAAAAVVADDAGAVDNSEQVLAELQRLRQAVLEAQGRAGAVANAMAKQVEQAMQEAVAAVGSEMARGHSALAKQIEESGDDPALAGELSQLRQALIEAQNRNAASVAKQVEASVAAMAERVDRVPEALGSLREEVVRRHALLARAMESRTDEAVLEAVSALGGRIDRVPDALRGTFEEVQEIVAEVAGYERERTDQARAVLDAVGRANQEHQEVLQALHSSLAKRFDVRTKTVTEALDGLAGTLEAARKLGPSLDKVSSRLDAQQPYLDQIRHQLVQLAATVATVPADVERRHAEASTTLEKVADSLSALRKHAAALDRSVQTMRTSHEGLAAAVVDLRDGQGVVPQRLDQIGTAVQSSRQQIGEVGELTRTVAAAVEQQQAMGNRLAELVSQVRAATRSDIERVESSIHLEVLKQHQQDQARLTQAVAGVSEVVEREAAGIAQRVSSLAGELDAIRIELTSTD